MNNLNHKVCIACLVMIVLTLLAAPSALARTWSGRIFDAITGEPLQGVTLKAGVKGRADPFKGYKVETDEFGQFSVTWPRDDWDSWKGGTRNHYLRLGKAGYIDTHVVREQPESHLTVELMPRDLYVKGQLIQAGSREPLVGVKIALGVPGRIVESVITDQQGMFAYKPARLHKEKRIVHDYPLHLNLDYDRDPGPLHEYRVLLYDGPQYNRDPVFLPAEIMIPSGDGKVYAFVVVEVDPNNRDQSARLVSAEVRGLKAGSSEVIVSDGYDCERMISLIEELRGMIKRAESNNAAHPNFIADLYRWLEELEAELTPSADTQWGAY